MVLKLTTLFFECVDDLGNRFGYEYQNTDFQDTIDTLDDKGYCPILNIGQGIFVPGRLTELHYGDSERILTFSEFKKSGRPNYL